MCSRAAAAVIWRSSAMATKYSIWRVFTRPSPDGPSEKKELSPFLIHTLRV